MRDLMFGDLKVLKAAIAATAVLSLHWGVRFAVLGVYVNSRSREKEAALTGQPAPIAIDSLVKAASRKLRRIVYQTATPLPPDSPISRSSPEKASKAVVRLNCPCRSARFMDLDGAPKKIET